MRLQRFVTTTAAAFLQHKEHNRMFLSSRNFLQKTNDYCKKAITGLQGGGISGISSSRTRTSPLCSVANPGTCAESLSLLVYIWLNNFYSSIF